MRSSVNSEAPPSSIFFNSLLNELKADKVGVVNFRDEPLAFSFFGRDEGDFGVTVGCESDEEGEGGLTLREGGVVET